MNLKWIPDSLCAEEQRPNCNAKEIQIAVGIERRSASNAEQSSVHAPMKQKQKLCAMQMWNSGNFHLNGNGFLRFIEAK